MTFRRARETGLRVSFRYACLYLSMQEIDWLFLCQNSDMACSCHLVCQVQILSVVPFVESAENPDKRHMGDNVFLCGMFNIFP